MKPNRFNYEVLSVSLKNYFSIGMADQPPDRPVPQSNKCRICEERYSAAKYPVSLPCGHVLCTECEQGVSRMNAALCPFCRRRYGNSDLRRVYNDAEEQNPHEELLDVAGRIRNGSSFRSSTC